MSDEFDPNAFEKKLDELDRSQRKIEDLSKWCISHMDDAREIVGIWNHRFYMKPHEKRVAFLYLANDVLQNSRRMGSQYIERFFKVLPHVLCNIISEGNKQVMKAATKLIHIWEDREVFGSHGSILKKVMDEHVEFSTTEENQLLLELQNNRALERILSGYKIIHMNQMNDEEVLDTCKNAVNSTYENLDKEVVDGKNSGDPRKKVFFERQCTMLRNCSEQLTEIVSSRKTLMSYLREALEEQESKLSKLNQMCEEVQDAMDNIEIFTSGGDKKHLIEEDSFTDSPSCKRPKYNYHQPSFTPLGHYSLYEYLHSLPPPQPSSHPQNPPLPSLSMPPSSAPSLLSPAPLPPLPKYPPPPLPPPPPGSPPAPPT